MTGTIILAAGASTRLGRPKQLLLYNNKSLLQHAIDAAVTVSKQDTIVVLGANAELIQPQVKPAEAGVVINENWEEGMGSSIRTGLSALLQLNEKLDDVIIMLADQPFVNGDLLKNLQEKKRNTGKEIVACFYKEQPGVPALFGSKFFTELLSLQSAEGAKKLFFAFPESVATVPFPFGSIDIDTMQDYNNLTSKENNFGKDFFNTWC